MARTRMALSFVIVDKKLASTNPFDMLLLSFSFGLCTREADRNYTSLVTVHFARLKNLQQRYDITTDVRYDLSHCHRT